MSISATFIMDETTGRYVPFRGVDRSRGPIGTYYIRLIDTGDAGGGTVQLTASLAFDTFGFHPLFVPRMIGTRDTLASPVQSVMNFQAAGNERLDQDFHVLSERVAAVVSLNVQNYRDMRILIEPSEVVAGNVLGFNWTANVDGKTYIANCFFVVYDLEAISKGALWTPDEGFINS